MVYANHLLSFWESEMCWAEGAYVIRPWFNPWTLLVSFCCYSKTLQLQWLKITQIYSLLFWRQNSKIRVLADVFLLEASGEDLLSCFWGFEDYCIPCLVAPYLHHSTVLLYFSFFLRFVTLPSVPLVICLPLMKTTVITCFMPHNTLLFLFKLSMIFF